MVTRLWVADHSRFLSLASIPAYEHRVHSSCLSSSFSERPTSRCCTPTSQHPLVTLLHHVPANTRLSSSATDFSCHVQASTLLETVELTQSNTPKPIIEKRPLVASPPNRRRAAAGRRMPKVRDGARNRNRGVVVLCLHDDGDNDREASTSGAAIKPAASSRGSSVRRAGAAVHDIGVGVGVSAGVGEDQQQPEVGEHPRKRLLPVESLAHPSNQSLSRKRNKAHPPTQPRSLHTAAGAFRGSRSKGESSWLALRRALHERYRDSEEHGAAEKAAAEAAENGRGGRAGSSKVGRGDCGGEVMSPGIR